MTKAEAADYLGCSVRQLERYTADNRIGVRMEKGRTRPTPVYDEGELQTFKTSLERVVYRPAVERMDAPESAAERAGNAIATQGDGALSGLSQAGAQASQMEAFARFIVEAVQAEKPATETAPSLSDLSAKLLLSLPEAQALTGLSRETLRAAIEAGELAARQLGRGWKIKRRDLESYIENL